MSALEKWLKTRDWLSDDLLGGPKVLKASWVINAQKGGTLPFVLALMWAYDCWTPTAWTYAALHGSYGLCWLLKDQVFPDLNWEKRVTFAGAVMMWVAALGLYWIAPVLIVTNRVEAPTWLLGVATLVYVLGVVIMMGSDGQKYFTLKVKRGLITDGFFARVRHPNYLGEMMLYGSFAALSLHWAPWVVLAFVWTVVFLPNMVRKERSMARYPEWPAYLRRSGFLLPRLFAASVKDEPVPAPATPTRS
jgi:protein-S-isoprenylcysteine O-methyltransferase Ste14